jgi:hypothetical protein
MGEFAKAADQHEYLYYIQQKAYASGSKEALAAKQEWADWNLQYFLSDGVTQPMRGERLNFTGGMNRIGRRVSYLAVQNTTTGFTYYIPEDSARGPGPGPMTADDVLDIRLVNANKGYEELMKSPVATGEGRSELVLKKANVAMAIKRQMDAVDHLEDGPEYRGSKIGFVSQGDNLVVMRAYATTRDDLQSLAKEQEPVSPTAAANAWIMVGDWELRFGNQQTGKKAYEKALGLLAQSGLSGDELARAFNPAPLTLVPAFAVHPFTRAFFGISPQTRLDYKGHIDLDLSVTELGQIRFLNITDASPNTSVVMRRMLLTYLRKHPVRPLVQDGKLVKESALSLRVYYAY